MIHHSSTVMTVDFTEIWALNPGYEGFCAVFPKAAAETNTPTLWHNTQLLPPDSNQVLSQYTMCLFAHLKTAVNML